MLMAGLGRLYSGEWSAWVPWLSVPIVAAGRAIRHRSVWWTNWTVEQCSQRIFEFCLICMSGLLMTQLANLWLFSTPLAANILGFSLFLGLFTLSTSLRYGVRHAGFGITHLGWMVATACISIPIWLTPVPPMADYPAHLARAFITQNIHDSEPLQHLFEVQWIVVPNLGFDVVMRGMLPFTNDIYLAGQCVLTLTVALLLYGSVFLHRTLWNQWSILPLSTGFLVYNACFTSGFISWSLSIGLALCFASLWFRLASSGGASRLFVGVMFSSILYCCHIYGFVFYGCIIGGHALSQWASTSFSNAQAGHITRRACQTTLALCIAQAIFLLPLILGFAKDGESITYWNWHWNTHLLGLFFPLWSPLPSLTVSLLVIAVGVSAFGFVSRSCSIPSPILFPLVSLLGFWLALPTYFMDTHLVSERFLVLFGVLLFSTWRWNRIVTPMARRIIVLVSGILLSLHISLFAYQWHLFDDWVTELQTLSKDIPIGSRVHHSISQEIPQNLAQLFTNPYTVEPTRAMVSLQSLAHIDALLTIERSVFVPNHFTHPSKHILTTQPHLHPLDRTQGFPIGIDRFLDELTPGTPVFHHPTLRPYTFLLVSDIKHLTPSTASQLSEFVVGRGERFWLLQNPEPATP